MTELQNNFKSISERMQRKFAEKESLFHYPPCIVPAWEGIINEMIEAVEEWNTNNPHDKVKFFQVKEKFGHLTVYLEPLSGEGVVRSPSDIRDKVADMAQKAQYICRICGEQKVETVHESRVQYRCLKHYHNDSQWRVRQC